MAMARMPQEEDDILAAEERLVRRKELLWHTDLVSLNAVSPV